MEIECKEIEINGITVMAHRDGSISKPFHGKTKRTFGTDNGDGYMRTEVGDKNYRLHRIVAKAFLLNYLEKIEVDHIDGNRSNNGVENLRMATKSLNLHGFAKKSKGCSSKYKGVCFHKIWKRWGVKIMLNRKVKYLGNFYDEVEAAEAYDNYKRKMGLPEEGMNFPC